MNEFEEFAKQFRQRTQARLEEFEQMLNDATRRPPAPANTPGTERTDAGMASSPGGGVGTERRRGRVKSVLREAGASAG